MSIERADFDTITADVLQELIVAQVPEGLRVEYKQTSYGNSDADKREFLKDVSALANAQGGHLILGVREVAGVAAEIVDLGVADVDAEIRRLDQIARGGLEPRISGLRMNGIPLGAGGHTILIRVPKSWNSPHRVIARGANRFFVRNSAGVHEPDVEELRAMFTASASALDSARNFRFERIERIPPGTHERPVEGAERVTLHIVPIASLHRSAFVDLEQVHARHDTFNPIGARHGQPRFNFNGVIFDRGDNGVRGYTQVFRNGLIEATHPGIVGERNGRRCIDASLLEDQVIRGYCNYINGLRDLGVPSPLIVMLTLEGVQNTQYFVRPNIGPDDEPELTRDKFFLPECSLEDYGEEIDHHRALRPAFDALWNAIGYPRSLNFNDRGQWVGPPPN